MKKLFYLFVIIGILVLMFSCEKEDDIIVPETPTTPGSTNTLYGYNMVDVAEDGTFTLNGTEYTVESYLTGNNNNLKSASSVWDNKCFFKPTIFGVFNERLDNIVVYFPEAEDETLLIDESIYLYGKYYEEDDYFDSAGVTYVVDSIPWYNGTYRVEYHTLDELMVTPDILDSLTTGGIIASFVTENEFTIDSNNVYVNYQERNYQFNLTILKIETGERFMQAVIDETDTVLFFNTEDYYEYDSEGRLCFDQPSMNSVYRAADEFGYYGEEQIHITDSTTWAWYLPE